MRNIADLWNDDPGGEHTLHLCWLLNPDGEIRRNVRVKVSGGIVVQITDLPDAQSADALPFALVPPFVNAHTHLEFSSLDRPLSPAIPFTDWIHAVIRSRTAGWNAHAISAGIRESNLAGVHAIGEITTSLLPTPIVNSAARSTCSRAPEPHSTTIVSFQECLGLGPQRIIDQLANAKQHLERLRTGTGNSESAGNSIGNVRVLPGLSPHAPYSVHRDLFDSLVDLASAQQIPLAMHLAETTAELQLLESAAGPFVPFLQQVGVWNSDAFPGRRSPMDYLKRLAELPHGLAIHGNYLTTAEQEFVSRNPQIAIVYCPRTHHYFQHSPHPWRELLRAGATVVLGTDSRASNPDLSIWKELQFVSQLAPDYPLAALLPLITTKAAAALGLDFLQFTIRENQPVGGVLLTPRSSRQLPSVATNDQRAENWTPAAVLQPAGVTLIVHEPGDGQ